MTSDDTTEDGEEPTDDHPTLPDEEEVRERIEEGADRAVEGFDRGLVDLLSWVLETETKSRIYVHLRQHPESTSGEIAEGTGLYPSTVREALAELHDDDTVERQKRDSDGAGNDPYEYAAIAPSDLVNSRVDVVQDQLNTVFNLDRYIEGRGDQAAEAPVTISIDTHSDEDDEGAPHAELEDHAAEADQDEAAATEGADAEPENGGESADAADDDDAEADEA
jgi:predicted transcriptional regulator